MAKCGEESHSFSYDVFISFRGEDTRHKFIGHLRKELCRKGINTFIDDKNLRIGEGISPALSKAIEESKISIVVFSENYASSKWCLDELVKILDCTKRSGNKKQVAFPIFYHVDPSHVRHQKESYHKAMIAHEDRFGKSSEKVCRWRSALFEIANLKGQHISTGYEIDYIEEIVEQVYANIAPKPLGVGQNPVGLEHRIEEVKSLLDMEPTDDTVCMLGIYGLGGIGKTELAKALYNKIVHQFEAASFLANVREKSNKINGMEDLQKTLLSEMLEELETELGSPSKGIYEIKRKLGKKKVLLVLDDVDDREQLKNLAGGCDWFGLGSRIIITTRDRKLLLGHQVEKIYEMTELDYQHSLELFCQNAFGKSHPETGYEDMSSLAVGYAKGLPLALKVIGSNLATERSLEDWELLLKKYERIPDSKIQHVLKISYNSLGDDDAKSIFLDIACFFKGERIEYVEKILEEFDATSNIKVLVNKSLLNVEHGCLEMHDLIQDMGREIVRQESRIPSKRSRLWSHKDVLKVLTEDPGSEAIEGIILDPPQREEVEWSGTAFEEMKWLRILIVRNTTFSTWPKYLPNHLRLLDWEEYPSESFPSKFHPKEIVVFNLCKSRLTLEEPFKKFSCLINMDLSHNEFITTMPDVSAVQNLRELRLDKCKNLIEVHESVGFLKKLAHLSASGCIKLKSFLHRMFLPSLEVLDLNLCARLEHFPDIVNSMNKPLKIYLINTAIKELPDSIDKLIGLVCIEIPSSTKLKYLPSSLFTLPNVVAFKMGGCSQLRESFRRFAKSPSAANGCPAKTLNFGNGGLSDEDLQTILNCFPKLEELIASENNFVSLPACIKESIHLTSLDVSVCKKLQEIPECTNLRILNVHRCMKLKYISELPSTIQKVDARYCFSLTKETLDMLWYQVSKEIRGLEIVMPQTEITERFDFIDNGGNPRFWVRGKFPRGKFPVFALALVFRDVNEKASNSRRQLVELQLIINGQCVPHKGYYSFRIAADHVLVCDLRLVFSEEEWKGLDSFLVHDWNLVLVSYEAPSTMTLSCWGVFMYKQETNMEDVQFMCPDPIKYSDMALISPPTILRRDPKQELRKMIDQMCLDEMFDGMLMETMDYENRDDFADKGFAVEQMHVLMGGLKEISTQAKDVLEGKAVANKNSTLAMFLEAMEKLNEEAKKDGQETIFFKDLALIRLKDGVKSPMEVGEASTSGHQGSSSSDPQQQEIIMEIFSEGMVAGLLEAQNSFPTLDIETTMHAALEKGNRVRWSPPESEVENPVDQVERKIYMEGVINGLLEAQLSFPTLDIQATLDAVLLKYGGKPPNEVVGEVSSSSHQQESSETQSSDPEQRQIMMEMFWDGVLDGLNEVKNKFPSLHIGRTVTEVFNKGNRVRCSNPGTPMEKRIYIEGIVNGLFEAQLSFPTLDINATLDTVLSKGGRKVADKKGKQPMDVRDREASTSSHQESSKEQQSIDPQKQEIMRENLLLGMLDGLLEAKSNFPTLDVETTIFAALNKGNRFKWLIPDSEIEIPEGQREDPLARLKRKMYMEGIINGLIEAQLSFPTLNIQATADAVLSNGPRRGRPIVPSSDDPLLQAFKMMDQESCEAEARSKLYWNLIEEHRALRKKFEQVENGTAASDKDSCLLTWKDQYDELLEKLNTQFALSSTEIHTDITKYEKLVAVLQGRAEELKRLYDASIEGFQNSKEFQDLMSVIYLYGLRDGLLEAQVILLALDMFYMDRTTPVFKENEECVVTDEAAKEVLDWTKEKVASSDDSLLQVFMMMKQESCESETKSKLYWKLIVEHKALRNKFEEFEIETVSLDKDSCNQYEDLLEKFNTQSAEFISEKQHNLDGTEDVQEKATKISDSKSALSNAEMQIYNGKEGCRGVTKYEKLAAVLKGRAKKLKRLYDDGIEGFQNSEEFQDLMSVIYFNGLKNGLLEAQVILLALDMDRMTPPLLKENEEHVTHEAADSENLDGSISAAEIPSPTDPKVDNPPDTSESSGEEVFVNFEDFGHMFF